MLGENYKKPEEGLKEVLRYTPKGVALDIGAGDGRNSIFLAKNGLRVEAIDKIKNELEKCKKLTEKYNLAIKTKVVNVKKFMFKEKKYALIIAIASLDFLKFSDFQKMILKIKKSLKAGGIFYLFVFSQKDPAFRRCKKKFKMIERNTFYLPQLKTFRHFFNKKEILISLINFKIIKIEEKEPKEMHDNNFHSHQIIRVIAQK